MKFKIISGLMLLLGGCSLSSLIDQSLNSFSIQASKNQESSIIVSWTAADYYASYEVLRSSSTLGEFVPISPKISVSSFTDTDIQPGSIYYYKVKGYNSVGVAMFTAEAVQGFAGGEFVYPPRYINISKGTREDKISLSWNESPKAVSYRVRRSDTGTGAWQVMANGTQWAGYEDSTVIPNQVYYYQIIAIDKDGVASLPSATVSGYAQVNYAQFQASAGLYSDYNELKWKNPEGTANVVLYRSDAAGSLGSRIAEVSDGSVSFQDHAALPGVKHYTARFFSRDSYLILQTPSQEGYRLNPVPAPQGLLASQGDFNASVQLSWDAVSGADSYTVQRSLDSGLSWQTVGSSVSASLADTGLAMNQSSALYRVSATEGIFQGPYSSTAEGWPARAPRGLASAKVFGNRVELSWQPSRDAVEYEISVSSSPLGPFVAVGTGSTPSYSHPQNIASDEAAFYYVVKAKNNKNVWSRSSYEDYGSALEAWVAKASAPQNLLIRNNKTAAERHLALTWTHSRAAAKYIIYRATLMHGGATVAALQPSDYSNIAETENPNYSDTLSPAPIRRYHYKVALVDGDGAEYSAFAVDDSGSEIAYRLPVDNDEFMMDIDYNIIEAQMRIANFGNNGSSGQPKGRWLGWYDYKAAATGAKSLWYGLSSFETILTSRADHKINISISPLGAKQNGSVDITGLYTGVVTYNNLVGAEGGWSVGGSLTATYHHPSGTRIKSYTHTDAKFMLSVVIQNQEPKPSYPPFSEGGGGILQPGWSR